MITEVIMPKLGLAMEEGTVSKWFKKEGDRVEAGEPLLEITTDKANVEIEASASGILRKILVGEGITVPVTQVIAYIGEKNDKLPEVIVPTKPSPLPGKEAKPPVISKKEEYIAKPGERILASPLAKKIAREHKIDLRSIKGTGPGGRISKEDVLAALKISAPSTTLPPGDLIPLSKIRRLVAEKTLSSKRNIPHYYLNLSVDMEEAEKCRERLLKQEGLKISVNDLLIKAVGAALVEHPPINAALIGDKIQVFKEVNIGMVVSIEEGLIIPVIKKVPGKSLKEISSEAKELITKAKSKKILPDEFTGGTFTISNLGMFEISSFMAVINEGESGMLAVGAIEKRPAVIQDKIVIRPVMELTLSADHRIIDGVLAAQFLNTIKKYLEDPASLERLK